LIKIENANEKPRIVNPMKDSQNWSFFEDSSKSKIRQKSLKIKNPT
jgi:hypothetical protein